MLKHLARALADSGLDATPEALLDILWLAEQLPLPQDLPAPPDGDSADPATPARPAAPPAPTASAPKPPGQRLPPRLDNAPAVGSTRLYAASSQGQLRAGVLRVPGVSSTPAPVQLRQALRPLNRRVASTLRFALDEEASAERRAETGHWDLLLRGVRERWFDLQLVVDGGDSMALWAADIEALQRSLRGQGGFRSLRRFTLDGDGPLQLRRDGSAPLRPSALAPGGARPLVLLLTDTGAAHWRDGRAQRWLWSASAVAPLAVMNLLPLTAWRHSALGVPTGAVWWSRAGESNVQLRQRTDVLDAPLPDWRAVPVLGLEAASVGAWARAVTAGGGAALPAIWVGPNALPAAPLVRVDATPEQRIASYRRRVSAAAYELAVFLCVPDPLTVPVMRLVQRAMLPDSGTGELAECFQGGLIEPLNQDGQSGLWRLAPAVREALTRSLRYSEEAQVSAQLRRVGELLERSDATPDAVEALFPSPDGRALLAEWSLPFASVSRQILQSQEPGPAPDAAADAATTTDAFLDEPAVLALVGVPQGPAGDIAAGGLRIFATPTQQTWLVFSAQSITIVLDDAKTRASGSLVQRTMRYDEARPLWPQHDTQGATIGFGLIKGRWFYSPELFATPELLREAIDRMVKRHRHQPDSRRPIALDCTPDLAGLLPRLQRALRWGGWQDRLPSAPASSDWALRIGLIGRIPLDAALQTQRALAASRRLPLLDAMSGPESVPPQVPPSVRVNDVQDFSAEGPLLAALRRLLPVSERRLQVLLSSDLGRRGRAVRVAQEALLQWRMVVNMPPDDRYDTMISTGLDDVSMGNHDVLMQIIEDTTPEDLTLLDLEFRRAQERQLETLVLVSSRLQGAMTSVQTLAQRGGLYAHLAQAVAHGQPLFFDDEAHLVRVLQCRDDLHAAAIPAETTGRLLLFTGHTPDTAGARQRRFPPDQIAVAARAIADAVAEQQRRGPVTLACASGSPGGDLLFLEACQDAGIPTRLQLPMEPKLFVDRYLMGERGEWQQRFFRVMNRAQVVDVLPDDGSGTVGALSWRRNADTLLGLARSHGVAHSALLALWDRNTTSFPGGPTWQVEQAQAAGIETVVIDTRTLFGLAAPQTGAPPKSAAAQDLRSAQDALEALAERYDALRRTMPFGTERTAALTTVLAQMREHAAAARPMLRHFQGSQHAGQRLVAIAMLQQAFDVDEGPWLAQRLVDEKPFIGYHAARALLSGLEPLPPAERRGTQARVAQARDQLRARRVRPDVDLDRLIAEILQLPADPA